jgi:hypothetical protein
MNGIWNAQPLGRHCRGDRGISAKPDHSRRFGLFDAASGFKCAKAKAGGPGQAPLDAFAGNAASRQDDGFNTFNILGITGRAGVGEKKYLCATTHE